MIIQRHSKEAIRHLLAVTVLAPIIDAAAAIKRDGWRMLHMARAKSSHYNRHGHALHEVLRT